MAAGAWRTTLYPQPEEKNKDVYVDAQLPVSFTQSGILSPGNGPEHNYYVPSHTD